MIVNLILFSNEKTRPTAADFDKNIGALERAITAAQRQQLIVDAILLQDTKSILEAIKAQLPG